jgi:hypothetical protein
LNPHPNVTESVIHGLGWIYLILFAMNAFWTYRALKGGHHLRMLVPGFGTLDAPSAGFWGLYSAMLLMISTAHFAYQGNPADFLLRLPDWIKPYVDALVADPTYYFAISVGLFALMIYLRKWLVRPTVGWTLLNLAILFVALSMTDWDFRQIVGKPDNVPIVSMLFIVGFFTWLYFKRAVDNDERIARNEPVAEQIDNEKVLVWPDLVYTELICMVILTVVLVAWGILLQAPLEEPANSAKTPNPSKAPWYFLGLQEMLVYYDPWLAGVVFPSLILVGLMAIPYIDFNKRGNGYYSFAERKFAVSTFMFGFLPLWIAMIILGTFLRGPNWNIFGIYEYWDVHKVEALTNVNLSEYFWVYWLKQGLPTAPEGAGGGTKLLYILWRESPGFIAVIVYLVVLPPLLAATWFRSFFYKMGFIRFMVFANLLLLMAALPLKMLLRWVFNLKYIIAISEWFFNV